MFCTADVKISSGFLKFAPLPLRNFFSDCHSETLVVLSVPWRAFCKKKTGPKSLYAHEMHGGELAAPGGNFDVSGIQCETAKHPENDFGLVLYSFSRSVK